MDVNSYLELRHNFQRHQEKESTHPFGMAVGIQGKGSTDGWSPCALFHLSADIHESIKTIALHTPWTNWSLMIIFVLTRHLFNKKYNRIRERRYLKLDYLMHFNFLSVKRTSSSWRLELMRTFTKCFWTVSSWFLVSLQSIPMFDHQAFLMRASRGPISVCSSSFL